MENEIKKHNCLRNLLRISVLFLLTSFPAFINAQDAATLAKDGDSLYRIGNYADAIDKYEAALTTGRGSADLYYNLGNAYYRENQNARAILNYERALRLRPGMTDARENLALANERTQDRITELPQWFMARWWNAMTTKVSPTTWRIVWLVLLALVAAAVVCLRIGRGTTLRRWSLLVGLLALIMLVAATVILYKATMNFNSHSSAVVMDESVAVKSSPEARSADKIILHEGTRVTINESLQGWEKITIADGTSGWCPTEAVERI